MDTRRWLVLLGAFAVGAAAFWMLRRESCPSAAQKLATIWDAGRRLEMKKSFAAERGTLKTVEAALDAFASTWSTAWDESCSDRAASSEALARKRVCLDGRLSRLAALTELFARPDSSVMANAAISVERLNAFGPCNENIAEVPRGSRGQIAMAQRKAARSDVLRRAGKHADALSAANEAVVLAESAKYLPVLAEALLARADVQRARGKLTDAEATLDGAALAAKAGSDFETLARICISHLVLEGSQPSRADKAEAWVTCALDALAKLPDPALSAELALAVAVLRMEQHRPKECEAGARLAREAFSRNKQVARMLDASGVLAQALASQGKLDEAVIQAQAVFDGRMALLGNDHVHTLRSRIALGEILLTDHRAAQALAALEPVTQFQVGTLPPIVAASALCCRGTAKTRLLLPAGLDDLKGCVSLATSVYGDKDPITAAAHDALAAGWRLHSKPRLAADEHELAIAGFGSQASPETAAAHASYALTLLTTGDFKGARTRARTALAIFDRVPKEQSIDPCGALWAFAEAGMRLHVPSAVTDARAALGCLGDHPFRKPEVARASLTLASMLGHTPEAIALMKAAATDPSVQLLALDALAAVRPYDSEVGCAAAIEALVRQPNEAREAAAKGCQLPRLP